MSRKLIFLVVVGLPVGIGGLVVIIQQQGEHRLAAAMERFETEVGTLDPLAHAPAELLDDDNAAFWLQQGARALSGLSNADRVALTQSEERKDAPGPGVESLLARSQPALEQLHRAGELRASSWGIRYDAGTDLPVPDFLPHLTSKRALVADARLGLIANDRERVLAGARALVALRRSLEHEPLLVSQLIAMSVELAHHQLIQEILLHRSVGELADAATLEELAGQLDVNAAGRSLRATFAVEAAWMLQTAEAALDDGVSPWRRLLNVPARMWAPMEYSSAVDFYFRMAKATEMPVPEVQRYLSSNVSTTPGMRIIADMLVPNLVECVEKDRASAAARQLASLALQARLHALEHGAYPDSLGSLAAAGLTDPYSGGALDYTRHADGSAEVSFPGGAALWQQENLKIISHRGKATSPYQQPRFVWRLPGSEPAAP